MPRSARRLAQDNSLRVVTLGSSSTAGYGASSPDRTYPHLLQERLSRLLPSTTIEVINRGINGQLSADMVERLNRDAIELDADLVIWQTGTNDALSRVDLDEFGEQLERGVQWLAEAGIDLILVDPQFYPGVRHLTNYERYIAVMQDVADRHAALLFPRYAIMRHWALDTPSPALLAADGFHMNDAGYACLANLLADTIVRALTAPLPEGEASPENHQDEAP